MDALTAEKTTLYVALTTQLAARWPACDAWVLKKPAAYHAWCALDTALTRQRTDPAVSLAQFRQGLARLAATFCMDREKENGEEGHEEEPERL